MSKKLRKLAQSEAATRIITGFLAFCLVFEMLPAQSIAYALDTAQDALEETAEPPAPQDVVVTEATVSEEAEPEPDPEPTAEPAQAAEPESAPEEATSEAEPATTADPAPDAATPAEAAADPAPDATPARAYPAFSQETWTEDIRVTVTAAEGVLPEGTYVDVSNVTSEDLRNAAAQAITGELTSAQALRLSFTLDSYDGEPVTPKGDVRVTVDFAGVDGEHVSVLAVNDQGTASQLAASANVQQWDDTQQFTLIAAQATRTFVIAGADTPQPEPAEDAALAADENVAGGVRHRRVTQ